MIGKKILKLFFILYITHLLKVQGQDFDGNNIVSSSPLVYDTIIPVWNYRYNETPSLNGFWNIPYSESEDYFRFVQDKEDGWYFIYYYSSDFYGDFRLVGFLAPIKRIYIDKKERIDLINSPIYKYRQRKGWPITGENLSQFSDIDGLEYAVLIVPNKFLGNEVEIKILALNDNLTTQGDTLLTINQIYASQIPHPDKILEIIESNSIEEINKLDFHSKPLKLNRENKILVELQNMIKTEPSEDFYINWYKNTKEYKEKIRKEESEKLQRRVSTNENSIRTKHSSKPKNSSNDGLKTAIVIGAVAAGTAILLEALFGDDSESISQSGKCTCGHCGGYRKILKHYPSGPSNQVSCPSCNGLGYIWCN